MTSSRTGLPGFLRRSLRLEYDEEDETEGSPNEEDDSSLVEDERSSDTASEAEVPDPSAEHGNDHVYQAAAISNNKNNSNTRTMANQSLEQTATLTNSSERDETNNSLDLSSNSATHQSKLTESWQEIPSAQQESQLQIKTYRENQFEKVLNADVINMAELRKLAWNGIPCAYRAQVWKILLGYLPTNAARRQQTLQRKRAEYRDAIAQHYDMDDDARTVQEQETLRQVLVDVPRTQPEIPLFRNDRVKRVLSRLLYIWAMRHPASSYVQGINDLATPLLTVFLADYFDGNPVTVLDGHIMNHFPDDRLHELEADVYWCLTNLLAGIQDHYTADQPGVQRMVARLEELVHRIDGDLTRHIRDDTGIQFLQFSFKWMNCLLLREFQLKCVVRLWDTYLSEKDGFEDFHVYVCAAFMCQFSRQLQEMTFDELFGFMQEIPTNDWTDTEIEVLLSQAYVLSTLFKGSDAHLTSNNGMA
jgi:TBC1 domain family member 2